MTRNQDKNCTQDDVRINQLKLCKSDLGSKRRLQTSPDPNPMEKFWDVSKPMAKKIYRVCTCVSMSVCAVVKRSPTKF